VKLSGSFRKVARRSAANDARVPIVPRFILALVASTAVLAAIAAALVTGSASARHALYVSFRTPSGNIGCAYSKFSGEPGYLRCEIVSGLKPRPRQVGSCQGDFGRAVSMNATGRSHALCITDTVINPAAPVLAYRRVWQRGGFRCVSRTTGLTCTNLSRHGWFLSRARSRIF
jgi:hypothetical protein